MTTTAVPVEPIPLSASCVKLITFKGTKILIHWSFLVTMLFFVLGGFITEYPLEIMLYWLIFWGPMVITSILLREMGRIIVTKKLGGDVPEAIIHPLGSLSYYGPTTMGIRGDLMVALSGPILQIPFMILLAILYQILKTKDMSSFSSIFVSYEDITIGIGYMFISTFLETFWYNMLVILLNIFVPIFPFDSTRIWVAILKKCGASLTKSAKIISIVGMLISGVCFIIGILELLFIKVFGFGLFEFLFGAFGLFNSKFLYDNVKAGRLNDDPIFCRACYAQDESDGHNNSTTIETVDVLSPEVSAAQVVSSSEIV